MLKRDSLNYTLRYEKFWIFMTIPSQRWLQHSDIVETATRHLVSEVNAINVSCYKGTHSQLLHYRASTRMKTITRRISYIYTAIDVTTTTTLNSSLWQPRTWCCGYRLILNLLPILSRHPLHQRHLLDRPSAMIPIPPKSRACDQYLTCLKDETRLGQRGKCSLSSSTHIMSLQRTTRSFDWVQKQRICKHVKRIDKVGEL